MHAVANPWAAIVGRDGKYILDGDQDLIDQHNNAVNPDYQIIAQSIPEPFIGNPQTARVILLGLNPGHSHQDAADYARPEFRAALFNNLEHVDQPFSFYPLNPLFETTGTGIWWTKRLRQLLTDSGLTPAVLSARLMVIEWFPYHSIHFRRLRVPSQAYSFHVAAQLLAEGRLVVRMRSERLWSAVGPFQNVHALSNPQCAYITPNNARDCYETIIETLRDA